MCAEQARDLLHRLLCKDPHQRIGSGNNGGNSGSGSGHSVNETSAPYSEIMAHAWFADIDWATLNSMPPPWYVQHSEMYTVARDPTAHTYID